MNGRRLGRRDGARRKDSPWWGSARQVAQKAMLLFADDRCQEDPTSVRAKLEPNRGQTVSVVVLAVAAATTATRKMKNRRSVCVWSHAETNRTRPEPKHSHRLMSPARVLMAPAQPLASPSGRPAETIDGRHLMLVNKHETSCGCWALLTFSWPPRLALESEKDY